MLHFVYRATHREESHHPELIKRALDSSLPLGKNISVHYNDSALCNHCEMVLIHSIMTRLHEYSTKRIWYVLLLLHICALQELTPFEEKLGEKLEVSAAGNISNSDSAQPHAAVSAVDTSAAE